MNRSGLTAALLLIAAIDGLRAQAPGEISLGQPDARLSEPFSLIRGLRELPDGRLLVTDWIEQRLAVVDLVRDAVSDRGRVGAGPGEYRLPAGLLPFRADSSLLIDMGNGRLTVIDADGRIGRSFQPTVSSALYPGGVDADGDLYFTIPQWSAERQLAGDSIQLGVWDPDTRQSQMVATIHGMTLPPSNYSAGPRVPFVIFARQDSWAVSPSGRLAIVRGGDYVVEWWQGERRIAASAPTQLRPIPATTAEQMEYVRQFLQSSPTSGKGPDGGMGHTSAEHQTDDGVRQVMRYSTFAETLPFFRPGDVHIDARGRAWVGRWLPAAEPRLYDLFDADARHVASVRLPANRRLLALGRAHVYLVATDGVGLETIERYLLPETESS